MQKVLVIDDQPLEGEMIEFVLARHRPDVQYVGQAINAASGVSLAGKTLADIIFLDIKMPGMDGITAINHLRRARPDIQIIMLTAFDDFDYIRSALRAGAKDYLLKPIRPEDVLSALDRCKETRHVKPDMDGEIILPASGAMAEKLKAAIMSGDEDEAERMAEAYLASFNGIDTMNFVFVCVSCMELASGILQAHGSAGGMSDGLAFLYQDFVRSISDPRNRDRFDATVKQFARRSATMFGHSVGDVSYGQVAQAKRYIQTHLHEDITLNYVAKRLFLSPAYLSRLFRIKTGQTFSAFLSNCRTEHAKLLLSTTDLSVSEVAASIGYSEANSFSRFFKSETGMSPSIYRSRQKNKKPPV